MFEKIKDYLYDISDILLSLILIIVIAVSITYKITDAFTIKIFNPANDNVISVDDQFSDLVSDSDSSELIETDVPSDSKDNALIKVEPSQMINFEINRGLTGYNIAKILFEKELITSVDSFIKRIEELNLGNKLRSGTYSVSSNIDMDDLIYIISGQKR